VHSGSEVPSNKIGNNGDIFILNKDDEKAIYLKENGKWD
jgi:hypothetical protein